MKELMSDRSFVIMSFVMKMMDIFHPRPVKRAKTFGIKKGNTVVDYACGPGRYTIEFAQLVGDNGKVFAVDIKEIALREVERKAQSQNLKNIQLKLAKGYNSSIDSGIADIVVTLDVFFMVENPTKYLEELARICRNDGILVIDDGHQSRKITKKKIQESGVWEIIEESKDHLKCRKNL